jgi:hypothetical protein
MVPRRLTKDALQIRFEGREKAETGGSGAPHLILKCQHLKSRSDERWIAYLRKDSEPEWD